VLDAIILLSWCCASPLLSFLLHLSTVPVHSVFLFSLYCASLLLACLLTACAVPVHSITYSLCCASMLLACLLTAWAVPFHGIFPMPFVLCLPAYCLPAYCLCCAVLAHRLVLIQQELVAAQAGKNWLQQQWRGQTLVIAGKQVCRRPSSHRGVTLEA
jgi:hypothetical protein